MTTFVIELQVRPTGQWVTLPGDYTNRAHAERDVATLKLANMMASNYAVVERRSGKAA